MPIVLLIIGLIFVIAGIRGTHKDLIALLEGDFTGPNNFFFWILAIVAVGLIGYIEKLRPLSDGFLVLVIVVILLSHSGFFAQFISQLKTGTAVTPVQPLSQAGSLP